MSQGAATVVVSPRPKDHHTVLRTPALDALPTHHAGTVHPLAGHARAGRALTTTRGPGWRDGPACSPRRSAASRVAVLVRLPIRRDGGERHHVRPARTVLLHPGTAGLAPARPRGGAGPVSGNRVHTARSPARAGRQPLRRRCEYGRLRGGRPLRLDHAPDAGAAAPQEREPRRSSSVRPTAGAFSPIDHLPPVPLTAGALTHRCRRPERARPGRLARRRSTLRESGGPRLIGPSRGWPAICGIRWDLLCEEVAPVEGLSPPGSTELSMPGLVLSQPPLGSTSVRRDKGLPSGTQHQEHGEVRRGKCLLLR